MDQNRKRNSQNIQLNKATITKNIEEYKYTQFKFMRR